MIAGILASQILFPTTAMAVTYTWDTSSSSPGIQDGAGTWDTGAGKFWNGSSNVNWVNATLNTSNADEAVFGGGSSGTAGLVTLTTTLNVNKLTLNAPASGSYTLGVVGNASLALCGVAGTGITSNTNATISSYLLIGPATGSTYNFRSNSGLLTLSFGRLTRNTVSSAQTFALAGAGNGVWTTGINNPFSDVPISISKAGAGTWTLSGYNGYTGVTTISEGTLSVGMIGNPTGAVVKNTNSVWQYSTTAGSATVTVGGTSPSTTGLVPGQYFYSNATPNGARILSVDSPTQFTLESGTGVLAQTNQPVAVFGEASNLGMATAAASNLVFNGTAGNGALKYTGTTQNTGRAFTINSGKVANIEVTNSTTNLTFLGATGTSTTGALAKSGAGTLTLAGTNTYTGATTVTDGTLEVATTGSLASGSAVTVSGGTLNVAGTVNGTVQVDFGATLKGDGGLFNATATIDGIHEPGASPGLQTFTSGLTYGSTATLNVEIVGNALAIRGTDHDGIDVTGGNLSIDLAATFKLLASGVNYGLPIWDSNRSFTVIDFSGGGTSTGVFLLDTSGAGSFAGEGAWSLANTNNDIVLTWNAVPEPNLTALLGGLGTLTLLRRRR